MKPVGKSSSCSYENQVKCFAMTEWIQVAKRKLLLNLVWAR